ncbi:MAG: hypothetical protein P8P83_05210 [Rickettsiaceae bacterium]|nr:hypothetical protein [Rickettsiaceae bacterium]
MRRGVPPIHSLEIKLPIIVTTKVLDLNNKGVMNGFKFLDAK